MCDAIKIPPITPTTTLAPTLTPCQKDFLFCFFRSATSSAWLFFSVCNAAAPSRIVAALLVITSFCFVFKAFAADNSFCVVIRFVLHAAPSSNLATVMCAALSETCRLFGTLATVTSSGLTWMSAAHRCASCTICHARVNGLLLLCLLVRLGYLRLEGRNLCGEGCLHACQLLD